jgi:hypothetical protein
VTMPACDSIFLTAAAADVPGYLSGRCLAMVMILPPMLVWCGWAVLRAWGEDTTRPQRTARRALRKLLAVIARRGGTPTTRDIELWRREIVRLWKIEAAAPTPQEVAAHGGEALAALWQDAEEALYSRDGRLPADWLARATQVVGTATVPPRPWPWPKLRRHWLPTAAAVAGMALWVGRVDAAEPANSPREPAAISAPQWVSAYLVRPRDEAVRAGLRQSLSHVDNSDPTLVRLLDGAWYDRVAGKLSPAEWERLARIAALAASLGLTLAVVLLYRGRTPRGRRIAVGVALLAGGAACAAFGALRRYGPLADARAAWVVAPTEVKMIPSELGARQAVTNLAPGTIVVVDKSFLGWDRVIVRDGVTGWIRTEQVAWLYRPRDDSRVSAEYAGR